MKETTESILSSKHITPIHKLALMVISEDELDVGGFYEPSRLSAGEIGIKLGMTRKRVLDELWCLLEEDWIETVVQDRSRKTSITKRLKKIIKKS